MAKPKFVQLTGELVVVKGGVLMKASDAKVKDAKIESGEEGVLVPTAPWDLPQPASWPSWPSVYENITHKHAVKFKYGEASPKLDKGVLYTWDGVPVVRLEEVHVEQDAVSWNSVDGSGGILPGLKTVRVSGVGIGPEAAVRLQKLFQEMW